MDELKQTVSFYPIGTKVTFEYGRDKSIQTGVIWGVRINSSVRYTWGQGDGNLQDIEFTTFYSIRSLVPIASESGTDYRMWDHVQESAITPVLL